MPAGTTGGLTLPVTLCCCVCVTFTPEVGVLGSAEARQVAELLVCLHWLLVLYLSVAQGLADTFLLLGMPFDSEEAAQLNKEIFECIYFACERALCSHKLAAAAFGSWYDSIHVLKCMPVTLPLLSSAAAV